MCGPTSQAMAQGGPKAPPGPPAPPPRTPLDATEPMPTLKEALKPLEDPNPERFKPTAPLFPKGPPPGKPDVETEDERKRKKEAPVVPYHGS